MSSAEFKSAIEGRLTSKVNLELNISVGDRTHFIVQLLDPTTSELRCGGTINAPSTLVTALSCVDNSANYPIIFRRRFMNMDLPQVHEINFVDDSQNYAIVHVSRIRKESR